MHLVLETVAYLVVKRLPVARRGSPRRKGEQTDQVVHTRTGSFPSFRFITQADDHLISVGPRPATTDELQRIGIKIESDFGIPQYLVYVYRMVAARKHGRVLTVTFFPKQYPILRLARTPDIISIVWVVDISHQPLGRIDFLVYRLRDILQSLCGRADLFLGLFSILPNLLCSLNGRLHLSPLFLVFFIPVLHLSGIAERVGQNIIDGRRGLDGRHGFVQGGFRFCHGFFIRILRRRGFFGCFYSCFHRLANRRLDMFRLQFLTDIIGITRQISRIIFRGVPAEIIQADVVETNPVACGVFGLEPDGDLPVHHRKVEVFVGLHRIHRHVINPGIQSNARLLLSGIHRAVRTVLLDIAYGSTQAVLPVGNAFQRLPDTDIRHFGPDVHPTLQISSTGFARKTRIGLREHPIVFPTGRTVLEIGIHNAQSHGQRMLRRRVFILVNLRSLRQPLCRSQDIRNCGMLVFIDRLRFVYRSFQFFGIHTRAVAVSCPRLRKGCFQVALIHLIAEQFHVIHQNLGMVGRPYPLVGRKTDAYLSGGLCRKRKNKLVRFPRLHGEIFHVGNRSGSVIRQPGQQAVSGTGRTHVIISRRQTVSSFRKGHTLGIHKLHAPTRSQSERTAFRAFVP